MVLQIGSWFRRMNQKIRQNLRWLSPGLGVKRWFVVLAAGTTLLGIGIGILLLDVYRFSPGTWWLPIFSTLSLKFLDRTVRALIFGGIGVGLIFLGSWGAAKNLLRPFVQPGQPVIDTFTAYHRRERGPRIVAIGGGNGLSTLLRGLKEYTNNITAIVTVADDGGSSGELRRNMGILPPGDIRNCLAALSNDEALLTQVFQYRFASGAGLNGHSLGNLLITALTEITGSFEEAVAESGRVLAIQGRVLPSTLHDVALVADVQLEDVVQEVRVKGESLIPQVAGQINRVWLEPDHAPAFPPTIQAILGADLIVIGPGSLYTSILPNLLVEDLAAALKASRANKFYICNVATQPGETDHFSTGDHIQVIEKHFRGKLFDLLICNSRFDGILPQESGWVTTEGNLDEEYPVYRADLIDCDHPWRHDSKKLAQVIMDLYYERTGPLAG